MLGGTNCSKLGGKKSSSKVSKRGGESCNRVNGGAKKRVAKKGLRKGVKRRGGSLCIGNLHPFNESADSDSVGGTAPAPAPAPAPVQVPSQMPSMTGDDNMVGGAKKRKSKKTGKSRKAGPYAKFVKKHFASVQKKNPKFKATDCIKEIAKMWKAQKK